MNTVKWRMIIAVIYATFAVVKRKPEQNSGLYGIWTLDLCNTGAVLYQLSKQANWKLSLNWFVINPWKDDDEVMNICKSYMWTAEWRIKWRMIIAVIYATFAVAKRMPYQPYPVQARIFFRLSFCNCKSCIYNTNDHPSFNSSLCSSHIWFSYIRNFMITIVDHQNCYYKVGTDLDVWGYFLLKFSFIFS